MSLTCIKTGFYGQLASGAYCYGDAFVISLAPHETDLYDVGRRHGFHPLLLRIVSVSSDLEGNKLHLRVHTWDQWFDETRATAVEGGKIWTPPSTMIVPSTHWGWLGYHGEEIKRHD
jgi:hypothetical protein